MALVLDMNFDPRHGEPVPVAPQVVRITANNPGPFTFHGTNSYIIGAETLAVIDPGPDDEDHLRALLAAAGGRRISHIFVTHTHRDHSPLARRLAEATGALTVATGALTVATGPHRTARPLRMGETNPLDAAADLDFRPDLALGNGELVPGDGWAIRCIATPGHAANHAAFALEGSGVLFCGDHVMAWATTVVAPPDGDMADFMRSLERLIEREDRLLLPGHGGPVARPGAHLKALRAHRRMREAAILERLRSGPATPAEIVAQLYRDTDPRLHGAAALSVFAHLEDLVRRGSARTEGQPTLDGVYSRA